MTPETSCRANVLVTAIGTAASTTIIQCLKRTGAAHIIGGDIYEANCVATSRDVDDFYVFPSAVAEQASYIEFALAFCRQHAVTHYFATIDEEVDNLSRNRDKFEAIGVRLCIPNPELVAICHHKDRFVKWVCECMPEIAIRTYTGFFEVGDGDYPIFIKPVEGRASIGCRRINDANALKTLLQEGVDERDYVIQNCLEGRIVTVDLIRNARTGQRHQIQRVENLRNSSGCGIAVEIIRDKALEAICDELMQRLDLNGVVNAEFFETDSGYKIIEVNPRFSAGCGYSCMAGCDLAVNALRIVDGAACDFGEIAYGKHFAKRYEIIKLD